MIETEANSYLQQEIEEAIRKRQKNFPGILNPKDIRRLTERAIIVILKENIELNDAQQKGDEQNE